MQRQNYRYLNLITAAFVTCLITANIIGVKLVQVAGLVVPAAILIFPLSYLFGDVLTEVYGYARAREVIWIGFACNALAVAAIWLGGILPPAGFWTQQPAYQAILGYAPRLLAASFSAYLAGEFVNSFVLARLKVLTRGRWLWTRTISSTLIGQGIDSLIFITLAFAGTIPQAAISHLILAQWLLKTIYEVLATPFTYAVVGYLKRREQVDYYDYDTDFSPFALRGNPVEARS